MRRLVLVLMLFIAPLQWGWAAVDRYCEHLPVQAQGQASVGLPFIAGLAGALAHDAHAGGSGVAHGGHAGHGAETAAGPDGDAHHDCGHNHITSLALPSAARVPGLAPQLPVLAALREASPPSRHGPRPERPQWRPPHRSL